MSRPRRSDHIREALIEAGIEQISVHGYHGTGIKQILDQVKVPKGSFYNFFASKEAFVAEVIAAYSAKMQQQLQSFIEGPGKELDIRAQLSAITEYTLNKIADSQFQHSCLIGALAMEIGAASEECQLQLQRATERWLSFYQERFRQGQRNGLVRQDLSVEQLAELYWACWEGSLTRVQMTKQIAPAQESMEALLNSILAPEQPLGSLENASQ